MSYSWVLWRHFLNRGSFFSDDSNVCQVDTNPASTVCVCVCGVTCISYMNTNVCQCIHLCTYAHRRRPEESSMCLPHHFLSYSFQEASLDYSNSVGFGVCRQDSSPGGAVPRWPFLQSLLHYLSSFFLWTGILLD